MLAVRSWVRAKGMTRLEFVAGRRAFLDYRRVNSVAREVAAQFSVGLEEVSSSVARLFEENKSLQRRVRALEEVAARVEAEELLLDARQRVGNVRVVARVFEGREAESLKQLALALISHERTIALLGSRDKEAARLVFARSAETEGDMNSLMREACMHLEGRGGGRPDLAQGGGHATDKLEAVIAEAARKLGSH